MCSQRMKADQHYVPKLYFRNFANNGYVCAYSMKFCRYYNKTPTQICYKQYLYETPLVYKIGTKKYVKANEIENHFQRRESRYSDLLKKIVSGFINGNTQTPILTSVEDELLAECVSNLLVRNPIIMDMWATDIVSESNVNAAALQRITEGLGDEYKGDTVALLKAAYKYQWLDERISGGFPQIIKGILLKMQRVFCVSSGRHFITSNYPIMIKTDEKGDLVCLLLPLSPNCLVTYNTRSFDKPVYSFPDFAVDAVNQVFTSGRKSGVEYIYGREKEDISQYFKEG